MECMGCRIAPLNASTFSMIDPITSLIPPYEAPFSSSSPTITPAVDVMLDPGMWDLINGLEKMNIDEADQVSILQMVQVDKNHTCITSSLVVQYMMAAPPPEEYATPFASLASVLQSHWAMQSSWNPHECWLCASPKHLAAQCLQKATRLKCTNCEEAGHYSKFCLHSVSHQVHWMLQEDQYE
ncbi:hypothetical protein CPB97_004455 [Podila verticillata]|nr:hypothetical protein CPB97_004455 [Podila verticillata]